MDEEVFFLKNRPLDQLGDQMNSEYRTKICNVLVIGSGGAGLRAAIAAHHAGCEVLVI